MPDPRQLRRTCRRARRALSEQDQYRHSRDFTQLAQTQRSILQARRIAAYIAADGELDPAPLVTLLQQRGKQVFLPVLRPHPRFKLWFLRYPIDSPLTANRYGIPEPELRQRHIAMPWSLQLLLVPLVAFDAQCNRMGMGAGYYDRSLAYLRNRRHWRHPRLVGIAHECQRVDSLPQREWDVPLDMVITERRVYRRTRQVDCRAAD